MWFLKSLQLQQERQVLQVLSSLSYRTGELNRYLQEIACGVSQLLGVDWSVITLCQEGFETVLASSIDIGDATKQTYSLHGLLTGTVVETGQSLVVEDTRRCNDYGKAPEGYRSYLGVPLRPAYGGVIGTICSFHRKPRKFEPMEIRIAEMFAERAATAIDNYHLYEQQRQFNQILEAEVAKRTDELRLAQAKLVEQERLAAIGEFAATIVHEIRNPLTTIKMGLSYFKRLQLGELAQERLDLSLDEAARLERLLREILLYAKPQVLNLTQIELNQFIASILEILCNMPEAEGRQIEFSPALMEIKVLGDEDKLKQIAINLVRNACEAIAQGESVKIQLEIPPNSSEICLQIHNQGIPIPPEVLPKLTQPFCTTKPTGTGLGLAIVKRIVDAHGGELSIQSSATEGTTVSVLLPLACNPL
jgi:signal transduction histidine kinase